MHSNPPKRNFAKIPSNRRQYKGPEEKYFLMIQKIEGRVTLTPVTPLIDEKEFTTAYAEKKIYIVSYELLRKLRKSQASFKYRYLQKDPATLAGDYETELAAFMNSRKSRLTVSAPLANSIEQNGVEYNTILQDTRRLLGRSKEAPEIEFQIQYKKLVRADLQKYLGDIQTKEDKKYLREVFRQQQARNLQALQQVVPKEQQRYGKLAPLFPFEEHPTFIASFSTLITPEANAELLFGKNPNSFFSHSHSATQENFQPQNKKRRTR